MAQNALKAVEMRSLTNLEGGCPTGRGIPMSKSFYGKGTLDGCGNTASSSRESLSSHPIETEKLTSAALDAVNLKLHQSTLETKDS